MIRRATKLSLVLLSFTLWTAVVYGQYEKAWSLKASRVEADKTNTRPASDQPKSIKYPSTIKLMNLPPMDSPDVSVTPLTNTTQSENSIAVSPLNPNIVLNSNNSSDFPVTSIYGASGFTSTDGGLTWYGSVQGTGGTNSGDPAVGIAYSGRFHNGYIAANGGNGAAYSTDNGVTWTNVQVYPNPGSLADKNHLWVDYSPTSPYVNNVYAAWTDFGGTHDSEIMFSRSTNGGVSWLTAIEISTAIAAGSHNQGVNIQTGPNGEVYVCWAVYDSWPSLETAIGFAKSTDGGATFGPAQRVITNIKGIRSQATGGGLLGGKDMRCATFPSMTTNMQNGHVYITWANIGVPGTNTGTERDVWVAKSTDGGTTWGTAVRVNQDTFNNGKDQWLPWIACDPVGGTLVCIFYDSRDFTSNDQANTYVAISRDGGATWEDFRVSDASWSGDGSGTGFSSNYAGDYIGIAVRAGKAYPVWTDRRAAGNRLNTWVSPFRLSDPTDPNPVTGVTSYSDYTMPTSMELDWNDPTALANGDPIDSFVVDVYLSGVLKGSVPKGTETFTGTGLTTYTQYSYDLIVRRVINDSTSSASSSPLWYAGGHPVPSKPTGLGVVGGPVSGTLSWTNPTTMLDGTPIHDLQYIYVYRNGSLLDSVSQGVPTTQYIDTPPDGGFYTYRVAAKVSTGYLSALSDSARAYIGPAPGISVTPDTLAYAVVTNGVDSSYYWIHNTGLDTLVILGIESEDVNPVGMMEGSWGQAQKVTPEYPKGSEEPVFGPVTEGHGGPDAYGYKWKDSDEPGGPVVNFIDISASGTQVTFSSTDDAYVNNLPIPFDVKFYGNTYNTFHVTTNGVVAFGTALTSSYLSNAAIPNAALPNNIIAALWDDLNGNNAGSKVYYGVVGNKFIIQYKNWNRYGHTGGDLNFEVILTQNSDRVELQYATMNFGTGANANSHTIGIENSTGTVGLQCVYNAAYIHNAMAIVFSRGVSWLAQTPTSGMVVPGDSMQVKATVDAAGLVGGTYYAKALIDNNVPLLGVYGHPIFKLTVTGVPDIGVSPGVLDYGQVFVTYPDTMSFQVTNTGTDVLQVTNVSVATGEYTVVGPTSFDVGVGASQAVPVVFESAVNGVYHDTVTVISNGFSGTKKVALVAEAISVPAIAVSPDSIYFDLYTNELDSATYVIRNTGTGSLVVSSIEAEEIYTAASRHWTQEQKYTPEYPKGAMGPVYGEVTEGRGGPDPFGYKWIDSDEPGGPVFNWVDIGSIGTPVTFSSLDDGFATVALPFAFPLYGVDYSSVNLVTNGFMNFGATSTAYSNGAIPSVAAPNNAIYPFWDDLNLTSGGNVKYYHDAGNNRFIVQYTDVPPFSGTGTYTFQVMLYTSGKILIQYLNMSGAVNSLTIGVEDAGGTTALQVAYNQAYVHNNLAVVISRGVLWMTQDQTGGTIASGDSLVVKVNVDATGLTGNTYLAKVMISSNDPDHPLTEKPIVSLHVIGIADIGVSPSSLDFGSEFINTTDTLSYTVSNTGTDQLNVTGMTHTAGQFTLLGPTSFSLGVGESQEVPVVFSSGAVGVFADTVVITSNGVSGTKTVTLAGEAIAPPDIEVDTLMALGAINEGGEDSTSMWIYNRGLSNLDYSIAEGANMFTALGFGNPSSVKVVRHQSRPVRNLGVGEEVVSSGGGSQGIENTMTDLTSTLQAPVVNSTNAQFDVQFAYDAVVVTGAAGNAGAVYMNGEFWTSRWASNILHRWTPGGTLIEQFTVSGVTGVRGMTWDGQYIYAGINTATIQIIDQATKTQVGTIVTSGAGSVRFIAYDPVRDGFWVGNFTGNIFCVNRSGSVIATMTSSLAGKYGAAYDPYSEGGPYLWVWDQGAGAGTPQYVYQYDLNTLTPTGVTFDVASVPEIGAGIAGGLFITDELVPGKATLGGMLQGNPGADKLWGLELAETGLVWLDVWPEAGTIAAGDSAEITLYMHGIVPQIIVPVEGYLGISSNDPDEAMSNVHVTMDIVVGVGDQGLTDGLPTRYALHPNYPNPFNPTTTIKYDLKEAGKVSLKVYNILGQEVRTLINTRQMAGYQQVSWDGRNNSGQSVSSGLYIYRLETEKFTKSRKMMLLK